jgi:hypothetical protein
MPKTITRTRPRPRRSDRGFGAATDDPQAIMARANDELDKAQRRGDSLGMREAVNKAWLALSSTADVAADRLGRPIPGGKSGRVGVFRQIETCARLRPGTLAGTFEAFSRTMHGDYFHEDKLPDAGVDYWMDAAEAVIKQTFDNLPRCLRRRQR